ncbi:hypothetical protein pdam_00023310 [Pocillopora damicornis]|uniref:Uncharacterized protein n=1 Tax=Pocillopora damicornis TaxID=46731 RepID=A0A3M6TA07_POCDA|nr:hypothetical protein pdam_00023310 [Pocillopora damicornis]
MESLLKNLREHKRSASTIYCQAVCDQNPIIQHWGDTPGPSKFSICLSRESSFHCKLLNAIIPLVTKENVLMFVNT